MDDTIAVSWVICLMSSDRLSRGRDCQVVIEEKVVAVESLAASMKIRESSFI